MNMPVFFSVGCVLRIALWSKKLSGQSVKCPGNSCLALTEVERRAHAAIRYVTASRYCGIMAVRECVSTCPSEKVFWNAGYVTREYGEGFRFNYGKFITEESAHL